MKNTVKKVVKKPIKKVPTKSKKPNSGSRISTSAKAAAKSGSPQRTPSKSQTKPIEIPQVLDTTGGVMPDAAERQGPTPKEVNDRFSTRQEYRHQSR